MPSRLLFVPSSRSPSERPPPAVALYNSSGGSPMTETTTSTRPSLSRSPKAQPRCARALHGCARLGRRVAKSAAAHAPEEGVGLPVAMGAVRVDVRAHVRVGGKQVLVAVVVEIVGARPPPAAQRP